MIYIVCNLTDEKDRSERRKDSLVVGRIVFSRAAIWLTRY